MSPSPDTTEPSGEPARRRKPRPLPPEQRRRMRVLWLVVLTLVGAMMLWHHAMPALQGRGDTLPEAPPIDAPPHLTPQTPDSPPPAPTPAPRATETLAPAPPPAPQFLLASRLAVAWHHLGRMLPPLDRDESRDERLARLREMAPPHAHPADQIRLAIVVGELVDRDAALRELDQIESNDLALWPALAADIDALRSIYLAARAAAAATDTPAAAHDIPTEFELELDEAQERRLLQRHGWFGELALGHGQPTADPYRAGALGAAWEALWRAMGVMLLVGVGLMTGSVLLIVAATLYWRGRLRSKYRRPQQATPALLETLAVFLALMLGGGLLVGGLLYLTGANLSILLYAMLAMVLLWPLARGMSWPRLRRAMGWRRGQSFAAEAGWGVVGYLAGIPILAMGLLATAFLSPYAHAEPTHPAIETVRAGGILTVLLVLAMAVIWAPLVEESLFRGALYHHLRRGWGVVASALVTGVLFAAIHPQGWVLIPALTAIGVVLALIREWRGSLIGCICAHALHNLVVLSIAFMLLR